MKSRHKAVFWIVVYMFLVLSPFIILFLAPRPPGREFLRELGVAFGFVGISLMGIQFIPTARLPFLADLFPMDTLYEFHHKLSLLAFGFTLAHPLLLLLNNVYVINLFNLFTAPARAQAGVLAVLALIVLVLTSARRVSLGLDYDVWHILHFLLTLVIIGFGLYHMLAVNYYTSVPAQRVLWLLMGVLWVGMILYTRVVHPIILLRRPYEVVEVTEERANSWSILLAPRGHSGFEFRAGQVAWLKFWRSPFSPLDHPFSIATSEERQEHVGFLIKELGDLTSRMGELEVGQTVYVDGPYGTFDLEDWRDSPNVYIAGGIGLAPIASMLRTLADRKDERPLILFYGNPTWESVILREEIEALQEQLNMKVVHILERPPEGWEGETGFIREEILERHIDFDCSECSFFACGPLPMLDAVVDALESMDVPGERFNRMRQLHMEEYEMA
ncbi:MAG: ferric reductase-like transmembrane domain-containing protein [Anaerolineales bacterium]